jgi:hypothetical protein
MQQDPADDTPSILTVSRDGIKTWRDNRGHYHRDDGPALEYPNGTKIWYRHGRTHRDDGPAMEWADGTKAWFRNGERHRDGGPAIEYPDGAEHWYLHGRLLDAQEIAALRDRPAAVLRQKEEQERQAQSADKIRDLLRRRAAPRLLPKK